MRQPSETIESSQPGRPHGAPVKVASADPSSPDAVELMEELSATLAQLTGDSGKVGVGSSFMVTPA